MLESHLLAPNPHPKSETAHLLPVKPTGYIHFLYIMLSSSKLTLSKSIGGVVSKVSQRMLTAQAVVFSDHGEPKDVLSTHTYEIDENNLAANQIVVKTLGSPVNPSDINQIQGVYPSQPEKTTALGTEMPLAVAGNEGLFEVLKVGSAVTDIQPGDWAVPSTVNFGTWRTHALCDVSQMMKIPNPAQSKANGKPHGLTVSQGATISVNPLTAFLLLTHYVKLTPGKDWVIQNGGNSAVGKFVSQILRILGFNSLSVIRDRPNLDEVIASLKETDGATQVITEEQANSREFNAEVKKWVKETGGEIKLGFNCVGGKSSTAVARKLANNGLLLSYGGMSYQPVIIPTSLHIFKNVTSAGFWVTALLKNDPTLKRKTMDQIVEWYEEGKLHDAPSFERKFEGDLAEVYKAAVAHSKDGKQIVTF